MDKVGKISAIILVVILIILSAVFMYSKDANIMPKDRPSIAGPSTPPPSHADNR